MCFMPKVTRIWFFVLFGFSELFGVESIQAGEITNISKFETSVFDDEFLRFEQPTEKVTLISSVTSIPTHDQVSISLNDWRVIRSIDIDVEAIGSDARLEVIVNGITKASLFVPGYDPHYFVTIADGARSIELRHVSGGRIKVSRLVATLQKKSSSQRQGSFSSKAAESSIDIIANINEFSARVSSQDYRLYLSPVKIRAGRVYAKATASGDTNTSLNMLMTELLSQMEASAPFIDRCLTSDGLFDVATEYLKNQYELDELLD